MKVRLRNNTLRLRVTQSEVATLARGARVTNVTGLSPDTSLTFGLSASNTRRITSTAHANDVAIEVPTETMKPWCDGDAVSLHAEHPIGDDQFLSILIEKDFACLAPRDGDDDVDCFVHPKSSEAL